MRQGFTFFGCGRRPHCDTLNLCVEKEISDDRNVLRASVVQFKVTCGCGYDFGDGLAAGVADGGRDVVVGVFDNHWLAIAIVGCGGAKRQGVDLGDRLARGVEDKPKTGPAPFPLSTLRYMF